jgi:23S rRNA (adenine2030-N6)-methyltransferase
MPYRHSFHAGNFADVHKHIALLQLIRALQKKAKGFLYLDTHAGEGLYDLNGPDARHSAESDAGILQLEQALAHAAPAHTAISDYIGVLERLRRAHGNKRSLYPGSPLLVATQLRAADQCICMEAHASIARTLQRNFEHSSTLLELQPRAITGDGYAAIKRELPPKLRRGLTLVDPPYEQENEERHLAAALSEGLARFETGVFAIWYPIKKQHESDLWLARVMRGITRPTLIAQWCLRQPDNIAGLNGSGLLIINPPFGFDRDAQLWQTELQTLLGASGGSQVKWLVHE